MDAHKLSTIVCTKDCAKPNLSLDCDSTLLPVSVLVMHWVVSTIVKHAVVFMKKNIADLEVIFGAIRILVQCHR